jgi:molybdopterin-guanine dinucleotide biosynthesis protein A
MKSPCTGVILAGGLNTRLSGTNKAFLSIGGKRIVDHIYTIFKDLFEDIILVTNDPLNYLELDCHIVTDIIPIRSSLTGIYTGLFYASTSHSFFSACDTPFLKKALVQAVLGEVESGIDVVIPETSAGMEPLSAVYSKRCLRPIEQQLDLIELKIQNFFKKVRVKRVPEEVLVKIDPELISFFNINTPEDIIKAENYEFTKAH